MSYVNHPRGGFAGVTRLRFLHAVPSEGGVTAVRPGMPATDVTSFLSSGVKDLLGRSDVQILSPVETGSQLRRLGSEIQAVAVPSSWGETASFEVVKLSVSGVHVVSEIEMPPGGEKFGRAALALGEASYSTPGPRENPSFVYSGREDSVFMVGGTKEGAPVADMWRYSVRARAWRRVAPATDLVPQTVLSTTYDSATHTLFVLDEYKLHVGPKWARLLAFDVQTGAGTLLAKWIRIGAFKDLAVTVDDRGNLLLMGARQNDVTVFRFQVESDRVRMTGFSRVHGKPFDRPLMVDDGLLVPVLQNGRAVVQVLRQVDFGGPTPCSSL